VLHIIVTYINPKCPCNYSKGVALNAESLEDEVPVPADDDTLFLKDFKNPNPVVKIAQLTSASSSKFSLCHQG